MGNTNGYFAIFLDETKRLKIYRNFHLTHSFPMHFFSTPSKHQKTVRFSDVFRG